MSAKNVYHNAVVKALVADGWTVTHDPLPLLYGGRNLAVDLGAEQSAIAAEKGVQRIAVEIQSFLNQSAVRDLEEAVGQFEVYRIILAEREPDRVLYMAVPGRVADGILTEPFGQLIVARLQIPLLVFDEEQERVLRWKS